MNHTERLNLTMRHELEIQKVVDLANCVGMFHNRGFVPEVIEEEEFFYEVSRPNGNHHLSIQTISEFAFSLLSEGEDAAEILERLGDHPKGEELMGVYLQVAVPVKKNSSFSWGHCRLQWVFGNTYEEAFNVACEWAKEQGHDYD